MTQPTPSATRASACPLDCPDACSLEVEVVDGRVARIEGTHVNPYTQGFLCSKVRDFDRVLESPDRLLRPGVRVGAKGEGRFRDASWDEALDLVARRLTEVRDAHGGEAILPVCYGGSNGFLTQDATDALLFARLGASRLRRDVCAFPSSVAAQGLYGKMVGVDLADYVHARFVVVWGTNPHATGIHHVPILKEARRRGAELVVIDPRRTPLAKRADRHLAPRPGTDLPLALSVLRWLFESGRADEAFLAEHARGVETLRERAAPWTFERAAEVTGVPAGDLEGFARAYADASPAVVRCGWGPERNRNGGSAVAAILALPAVAGKFGPRGGGYTMSNGRAWNLAGEEVRGAAPTRVVHLTRLGRALLEAEDPPIRAAFVYNANPLATVPDQRRTRAALEREDLFTVVFDQVMTDTARYADVVLPATTFLEHTELRRSYGSTALQLAAPAVEPAGEARPNYEVFAELCERTGVAEGGDPRGAAELVRRVLDRGGVSAADRARLEERGILFPSEAPPVPFVDHLPGTPDGKVHLVPEELEAESERGLYVYLEDPGDADRPLALVSPATSRTVSSTLGGTVEGPVPLDIHPDDAAARGIADGDPLRVFNDLGELLCPARVTTDVRPGTVCHPKGLWCRSVEGGLTSNALVPDTLSDVGRGACFNDARVEVERRAAR